MLFKPNCNKLLDLGLLVRHPAAGNIADAGIVDDLSHSHCRSLMRYEVYIRRSCGAPTSKFHYNWHISRIRVGPNAALNPYGVGGAGPFAFMHAGHSLIRVRWGANAHTDAQEFLDNLEDPHPVPPAEANYSPRFAYP